MKYFFLSGLPRAGSTLLSSILNQNPKIYASPSSPVIGTMIAVSNHLSRDELFKAFPKLEEGKKIIKSIPDNFYSDIKKPIVIDTNKSWTEHIQYIETFITEKPKIICMIRDEQDILNSFHKLAKGNPYNVIDKQLIKMDVPVNKENRELFLKNNGILYASKLSLEKAKKEHPEYIHEVDYKDLVGDPKETLGYIYDFLELENYEHDFTKIVNPNKVLDAEVYGAKDMHTIKDHIL